MRCLLFGASGQVGFELQQSLAPLGELKSCTREDVDLEDSFSLRLLIQNYKPEVIINAAAYTAVDAAESNEVKAFAINVNAVSVMSTEIKKLNGLLVHYSSDYVFDGNTNLPYTEKDQANPLSIYGKTKLQSEIKILDSNCRYFIFRTSWVYGFHGNNFLKTILRLASEKDELTVVSDQYGTPTSAKLIADITYACINLAQNGLKNTSGIYNLTPLGDTNWHGFANFIVSEAINNGLQLKLKQENILPIKSENYPQAASRPKNSILDSEKICKTFNLSMPEWEFDVKKVIKQLYEYEKN